MLAIPRSRLLNKISLRRSIYTGPPNLVSEKAYQKFKLKQARMQREDGRPTYLKCGMRDKIVYWLSWTATVCSAIANFKLFCKLMDEYH